MPPEETPSQQKVAAFCDLQVSTPETPIILHLPGETLSVAVAEAGLAMIEAADCRISIRVPIGNHDDLLA